MLVIDLLYAGQIMLIIKTEPILHIKNGIILKLSSETGCKQSFKLIDVFNERLRAGFRNFILDISDLTGIDTNIILDVIRINFELRHKNGSLVIAGGTPDVMKKLFSIEIHKIIEVKRNINKALSVMEKEETAKGWC